MKVSKMAAALTVLVGFAAAPSSVLAQTFQFGAIGDTGYSKIAEEELSRMINAMNREKLAFVIHVGDFEADPRPYMRTPDPISMPCTDAHYERVLGQFQTSAHPFILTPGDNDWTDCHLLKSDPKMDPLERLAAIRKTFFPADRTLGQRSLNVTHQSGAFAKFRENLAWKVSNVTFASMHIVGSNDNKGRTPEMDVEAEERTNANITWMRQAFSDAKRDNSVGLVLVTQANPGFETKWTPSLIDRYFRLFPGVSPPKQLPPSGFDALLAALEAEMQTYDKPTLFIHGDTHIFHVNRPLLNKRTNRFFENFTRLEVFGDPESHWVRVTVDPQNPELFVIEPRIVPENRARSSR
ncbi:MAG: hypothetical protein Q8M31_13740 [Beijerinckiaceae bacterium]|nr:hypothetical protein [Beijerinckiaceae bacterium]